MAKHLQTDEVRRIVSFQGASIVEAAISPDGRQLAVWRSLDAEYENGQLIAVPLTGGDPRVLLDLKDGNWHGIGWSTDSDTVYFRRGREDSPEELWRIPAAGGQPEPTGIRFAQIRSLVFHPDGKQLAFWGQENKKEIWVMENFLDEAR